MNRSLTPIRSTSEEINALVERIIPYFVLLFAVAIVVAFNFESLRIYVLQQFTERDKPNPKFFFYVIEIAVILLLAHVSCTAYWKEMQTSLVAYVRKLGYTPALYLVLYMACFGLAVGSIAKPIVVLGCLMLIYYIFCYANLSFISAASRVPLEGDMRDVALESIHGAARRHFDFVIHENSVSLFGYACLILVLGIFILKLDLGTDFVSAFCAGAATLHLSVSITSYAATGSHDAELRERELKEMVTRASTRLFWGRGIVLMCGALIPIAVYFHSGTSLSADILPAGLLACAAAALTLYLGRAQ